MNKNILISLILAIIIISIAYFLKFGDFNFQVLSGDYSRSDLILGSLGSEHSHISILIFIEDKQLSLDGELYTERADIAHFHDGDGTVIHKHTSGVTLPLFFETLNMKLTPSCLTLDDGESFCTKNEKVLSVYINREMSNEKIGSQELLDGDKILINYGTDNEVQTALKLNSVPDLPEDLSKNEK